MGAAGGSCAEALGTPAPKAITIARRKPAASLLLPVSHIFAINIALHLLLSNLMPETLSPRSGFIQGLVADVAADVFALEVDCVHGLVGVVERFVERCRGGADAQYSSA